MASQQLKDYYRDLKNLIKENGITKEYVDILIKTANVAINSEKDVDFGLKITGYAKKCCESMVADKGYTIWDLEKYCFDNDTSYELIEKYYDILKLEARYKFESYLYYMEKKRSPEKRFYLPRRKTMKIVVDDLQALEEGKYVFYGLSMPPRVGKSTTCIFFLSWVIGRKPGSHSAMSGHSGILAEHFYDEVLKLTTSDEYTFNELFPKAVLVDKSAENRTLKYDKTQSFDTLTCRGIDGTFTGAVDISGGDSSNPDNKIGYLYVDDMIKDRSESLSPRRLEKRYQDYLNVLVDRKNDGSRELVVATRWNVLDILGRVKKDKKEDPRYFFREIPALDDNDESNFMYDYGVGFSTEYYKDVRSRLDPNEWFAKYQQRPYVREGLLFEDLRFFNGVLPDGERSNIAACDVAWGGGDNLSMPFAYSFGYDGDVYVYDWIYNNGDKYATKPLVTSRICDNKPNMVRFEANNGGDEYAEDVSNQVLDKGFKTNITWKRASNQTSKMAKIIQYAPDIKRRFVFLEPQLQSPEYKKAIEDLMMFVQIGKNDHDDAPDSLVQLLELCDGGVVAKIEVPVNPFRW